MILDTISSGRLGVLSTTFGVKCCCGIGKTITCGYRADAEIQLRREGWERHRGHWQCPACLANFEANRLNDH